MNHPLKCQFPAEIFPTGQEMIPKMIAAGTDIFRLNCSHRRGGDFERVYPLIRKAAQELGRKAPMGSWDGGWVIPGG